MDPQIINRYFPELTEKQRQQIAELGPVYADWNNKINVVSRKDIDNLYLHHVLHSLAIAKFVQFKPGKTVLDVGTGGGFPGIPLAIMFPETQFHLVDSINKKLKVVQAATEACSITNVTTEHIRAEQLQDRYDFVITRAVAPLSTIFSWVNGKLKRHSKHSVNNGIIALKGGDLIEELKPFKGKVQQIPLTQYFQEEFFETKSLVYLPVTAK